MRIITGIWKGRRLKTVKGLKTRPTADKIKGAIFNILGSKVHGAEVLDLFAGTGNLALEALSRGAKNAVLIEKNSSAVQTIKENIMLLKAEDKAEFRLMDACIFLAQYNRNKYDLVFIDPPYYQGIVPEVLNYLKKYNILNSNGVVVIETASDETLPADMHPLELILAKKYGSTKIWFLQKRQETEEG